MTAEERSAILSELALLEAELARRRLMPFTQRMNPLYDPAWYHHRIAQELDLVLAGKTPRIMLFMPPQHGKTELASRNLVALALGRNPDMHVIFGTYNATRAAEVSGEVQRIMASDDYGVLFPGTRLASDKDPEVRQAAKFGVVGRRGGYQAAGIGQRIAGIPMGLGVIDDPYGSRADAESEAWRRDVWNWYVGDFTTRQASDKTPIVLIQTRWHEDDLAGKLLRLSRDNPLLPQWKVVSFPALCDAEQPDDPRKLGEALWPGRYSAQWLEAMKAEKGIYDWESLYQQRPVPPGGAMANRNWFPIMPRRHDVVRSCRAWDIAGTKPTPGRDPDWTVGTLLHEHADHTYTVAHVIRVRESPNEVDKLMLQTAKTDGTRTLIREERVGLAGKVVEAAHAKLLAGYDYAAVPIGSTDKVTRWRPFLVQAEAGNVRLSEGPWNTAWLDEMSMVPYSLKDDQADSVGLAFNELLAYKTYGPTATVILPRDRTGMPSSGEWRRKHFGAWLEGERHPDPAPPEPRPRRGVTFGRIE
jgi:predicted phage terminase large subunit-like protein